MESLSARSLSILRFVALLCVISLAESNGEGGGGQVCEEDDASEDIPWNSPEVYQALAQAGDNFVLKTLMLDQIVNTRNRDFSHQYDGFYDIDYVPGFLEPLLLPKPRYFESFGKNRTMVLPGGKFHVAEGNITQINRLKRRGNHSEKATSVQSATRKNKETKRDAQVSFSLARSIVDESTVDSLLDILRGIEQLDQDPDSVDGMPSYEIFVDSHELYKENATLKIHDVNPESVLERRKLRARLQSILVPIMEERLTPWVKRTYPEWCKGSKRQRHCKPCYSLIRRYRHGERQSHAPHHDAQGITTVVVSLNAAEKDFRGGLYISSGFGQREFLPLGKGDAVLHTSHLLHGVRVLDLEPPRETETERWSWIMWFRDSESCQDFGYEWFQECAEDGDPICLQLYASKVGQTPGMTHEETAFRVFLHNLQAAEGGAAMAATKIARAYQKLLPSPVPEDLEKAKYFYRIAIESHNPDGHYGLASILLKEMSEQPATKKEVDDVLAKVVFHLEEASKLGHFFAQFNLGIAHTFGYGMPDNHIDTDLAAEWFIESGIPEGFALASFQAASVGKQEASALWKRRAEVMGMTQPWRKMARKKTGTGGSTGVDLNLAWPAAKDGRRPPEF